MREKGYAHIDLDPLDRHEDGDDRDVGLARLDVGGADRDGHGEDEQKVVHQVWEHHK